MTEYIVSQRAYCKMVFHAAKYPHLSINGILLAKKNGSGAKLEIVDAIPMFHQCLYVTPMAEIALMQIEAYAESENMAIAGYYAASENFNENHVDKMPGAKIADKIHDNYKNACFIVLDNHYLSLSHKQVAIKVHTANNESSSRWSKAKFQLERQNEGLDAVSALLKRGAHKDVFDFDNHLDNPRNDWTNSFLNKDIQQLMAMY